MELQEFITATLSEIVVGVEQAIGKLKGQHSHGVINPVWGTVQDIREQHIQNVEFDVALTVSSKSAGGGEAGISVFSVKIGGHGSHEVENNTVTRIKFSVPVIPPVTTVTRPTPVLQKLPTYDPHSD